MAVLPLVLLASVKCRLITAADSTQAAEASEVRVRPVDGDDAGKENPMAAGVTISERAAGLPTFLIPPPMKVLSISVYDASSNELLWAAVPDSFTFPTGNVSGGSAREPIKSDNMEEQQHSGVDDGRKRELAATAGGIISEVAYGTAPNGFHQLMPVGGPARSLDSGNYLLASPDELRPARPDALPRQATRIAEVDRVPTDVAVEV
jgi:hypothetical protein